MSAFLVSKKHIDALVSARARIAEGGHLTRSMRPDLLDTALGRLLWRENMLSLACRYKEPVDQATLDAYAYAPPSEPYPVVALLKAAHCYEYQACEHPEWEGSDAARYSRDLREQLVSILPGYEQAPWGIE